MNAINKKVFDNKIENELHSNLPTNTTPTNNIMGSSDRGNSSSNNWGIDDVNLSSGLNYEKLFKAVSIAESSGCTSPVAKRTNNCVSIMGWKNGKRFVRKFASVEENKKEFIALWKKSYKKFPDLQLAKCYTNGCKSQGERPEIWLKTVTQHYLK